jgi:SAM-dependent methyltransferase
MRKNKDLTDNRQVPTAPRSKPHKTSNGSGDALAPSPWVVRFAALISPGEPVLDLACGKGRHSRYLIEQGYRVTAIDRDTGGVRDLAARAEIIEADLEDGRPYPLSGRRFAGIVVANYLHRPLLPRLVAGLRPGGTLIYETFARGNERFGKPANPAFLLRPGELLDAVRGHLRVLAYEDLTLGEPRPAAVQRIAAVSPPPAPGADRPSP